jgi:hypothetical protein
LFDIQGWLNLFLVILLALTTLFSSHSYVHLPFLGAVALDQQFVVLFFADLFPPPVGDSELATRCRLRAERERV